MSLLHFLLQAAPARQPSIWPNLLMMGGIVLVFYFFMIRPQMQRQKKEKQFRESLKKGDRIVTIGGVLGRIVSIEDDGTVLVEVDQNVKLRYERAAIREIAPTAQPVKA
jgi:preprotein translocase subunit YajC